MAAPAAPKPYGFLDIDNEGAFEAATRLLVDLGHRRIALLNGDPRYNFAADRETGFRDALRARGIAPATVLISGGPMHEGTGHAQALRLLDSEDPPTAFLCSSLAQAAGVRRACLDRGLRAGQDLALIAHDDRLQEMRAEAFDPPLTATQSPIGDAGRRIVELLVAMLRDPKQVFAGRSLAGRSRRPQLHSSAEAISSTFAPAMGDLVEERLHHVGQGRSCPGLYKRLGRHARTKAVVAKKRQFGGRYLELNHVEWRRIGIDARHVGCDMGHLGSDFGCDARVECRKPHPCRLSQRHAIDLRRRNLRLQYKIITLGDDQHQGLGRRDDPTNRVHRQLIDGA